MGIELREIAHARAGDKGNTSDISVFAYDEDSYEVIEEQLTAERLGTALAAVANGPVTRYELPELHGLNFVVEDALDGGVTTSLRMDSHGKSLSSLVLTIELDR